MSVNLKATLKLYLATDDKLFDGSESSIETVLDAVEGGVTMVQLRMKNAPAGVIFNAGSKLLSLLRPRGIPLIINDRVDIMLALDADGVHIGRLDLPLPHVRRLAQTKIVGYSVNTIQHLRFAEKYGADYVGIGPVFSTGTKNDTGPVLGEKGLVEIIQKAKIPGVGIGGITPQNAAAVRSAGAAGGCVVTAILSSPNPCEAAKELRSLLK